MSMENPMIEPPTYRLVPQHLNNCATAVPPRLILHLCIFIVVSLWLLYYKTETGRWHLKQEELHANKVVLTERKIILLQI